jgi:hypothetical protein
LVHAGQPDADRRHPTVLADLIAVSWPFAASRLALIAVGLLTQILIVPGLSEPHLPTLSGQAVLNMFGPWDTGWYVDVATHGYAAGPGPQGWVNWAFFPAYPLLSAGVASLLHLPLFPVMIAVSNLCFLAALALVRRFARSEFDERSADLAVALLCATPGSYVFSSAYTESLFLLALTAALILMRRSRWIAGGACAALAVLTRNLGLGLLIPMAIWAAPRLLELGRQARAGDPADGRRLVLECARLAAGAALPLAALAGFSALLYLKSGDPLAFVHAQKAWGRSIHDPLREPLIYLLHPGAMTDNNSLVSLAFVWLSFALLAALALMRRWGLLALGLFLTLVPLSTGIFSYQRYCLIALPLFLAGGRLLATRPSAQAPVLVALSTLNGFMMVAWALALGTTA